MTAVFQNRQNKLTFRQASRVSYAVGISYVICFSYVISKLVISCSDLLLMYCAGNTLLRNHW